MGHALINDILDFSKIEAGKINLEDVDFDLAVVVENTCDLLAIQAGTKHLQILALVDPHLPKILRGDALRLKQILINLLSNAIKFSKQGSLVVRAVSQSIQEDLVSVRISVTDTGIGIGKDELQYLFHPFSQADGSITRKFGGTGLGLSISQRLVQLMNGTIGVESVKGKGSTFWLEIPFKRRTEAALLTTQAELQGVRVLLVDDDPTAVEILQSYMLALGLRSSMALNMHDALRQLRQAYVDGDSYNVAILGLFTAEQNGLELASEILDDLAIRQTKLILLAPYHTASLEKKARKLGVDTFITQPVQQSQLLNTLLAVVCEKGQLVAEPAVDSQQLTDTIADGGLVLIAEDSPLNQQVAEMYLDELGFDSHSASTGKEAVTAASTNVYDLILMDCQMPVMDGFAATKQIRQAEAVSGRKTPIIAVTAHAMEGDRKRCIAAGMDDYISKPVDPNLLRKVIEKWLPKKAINVNNVPSSAEALPVIDLPALKAAFKPKWQKKLLAQFLSLTPATLEKIATALKNKERTELETTAHFLKGSCSTICSSRMTDLCIKLETAAAHGKWIDTCRIAEELQSSFLALQDIVTALDVEDK